MKRGLSVIRSTISAPHKRWSPEDDVELLEECYKKMA